MEVLSAKLGPCLAALLLTLLLLSASSSPLPRCGVSSSENYFSRIKAQQDMMASIPAMRNKRRKKRTPALYEIPVIFHVVTADDGVQGYVPLDSLQRNMASANDVLSGVTMAALRSLRKKKGKRPQPKNSFMRVALAGVTYSARTDWFSSCGTYATQRDMKANLAVSPSHHVNVYICAGPSIGWTSNFPGELRDFSTGNALFLHYSAFPPSQTNPDYKYAPYLADGDSFTHELGHFLGLLHTFGNGVTGCTNGDFVSDTSPQRVPSGGEACFVTPTIKTCPGSHVSDPFWNIMDYSDDVCASEFTPGQVAVMRRSLELYKPTLATRTLPARCVTTGRRGPARPSTLCMSPCDDGWCYTDRLDSLQWGECQCNTLPGFPTRLRCANKLDREEVWVDTATGDCVSAGDPDGRLFVSTCHDSVFQRWVFQVDLRIVSVGTGWCLTWEPSVARTRMRPCDLANRNQQWNFPKQGRFQLSVFRQDPSRCLQGTGGEFGPCKGLPWERREKPDCSAYRSKGTCQLQPEATFGCSCEWVKGKCVSRG